MTQIILRPGDTGFSDAFKYAQSYIEEHVVDQKIQTLYNAAGISLKHVVIASNKGRIIAIPSQEFSKYYKYFYTNRFYEKIDNANMPLEKVNIGNPRYPAEGLTCKPNEPNLNYSMSGRVDANGKFKPAYVGVDSGSSTDEFSTFKFVWNGNAWEAFEETINEEKEMIDNKLYVVLDGEHKGKYVNKVAVNAAGHFVVEAKGEAAYFAVAKESLERVLPYSVDVKFYSNGSLGDKMYSYWAKEGDVEVGDVIFGEYSNAMRVVAVNTKSDTANKWLIGSVIKPAKVLTGE